MAERSPTSRPVNDPRTILDDRAQHLIAQMIMTRMAAQICKNNRESAENTLQGMVASQRGVARGRALFS